LVELSEAQLLECCGSKRWVALVADLMPLESEDVLFAVADDYFKELTEADWLEAFAAHPRIGERTDSLISQREQAGALSASDETKQALADANAEYEKRFGFIFIVFASGKTPDEILAILKERLGNDRATELKNAAAEQRKITHARLERLLQNIRS